MAAVEILTPIGEAHWLASSVPQHSKTSCCCNAQTFHELLQPLTISTNSVQQVADIQHTPPQCENFSSQSYPLLEYPAIRSIPLNGTANNQPEGPSMLCISAVTAVPPAAAPRSVRWLRSCAAHQTDLQTCKLQTCKLQTCHVHSGVSKARPTHDYQSMRAYHVEAVRCCEGNQDARPESRQKRLGARGSVRDESMIA